MRPNFETIDYLESGNEKQRRAYRVLTQYEIMETLQRFDPLLTGTIPINIAIETSDLDIVCRYTDKEAFVQYLRDSFGGKEQFRLWEQVENRAVICSFWIEDFELEIFGQDIPSRKQNAYRHMLVEHYLLEKHGETFREQIISLKQQGYKTEPAFGMVLGLDGDPYEELLKLEIALLSS